MKTLTEFPAVVLKNALKTRQELTASGKTPEELPAAMGEALKLEGDKLKFLENALGVFEKRSEGVKRIVVLTLAEGEAPPRGAEKIEEHCFMTEFFPQAESARGRGGDDRYGRDDRGGRGGRGGKRGERDGRGGRDGKRGPGGRGGDRDSRGGDSAFGDRPRAPRGAPRDPAQADGPLVLKFNDGSMAPIPTGEGRKPPRRTRGPRKNAEGTEAAAGSRPPRERKPRAERPKREPREPRPPRAPAEPLSPTLADGRPRTKITYAEPEKVAASIAADSERVKAQMAAFKAQRAEHKAKRASEKAANPSDSAAGVATASVEGAAASHSAQSSGGESASGSSPQA